MPLASESSSCRGACAALVQLRRQLHVFGYTTTPNYDCGIRTVRVPIFKNETMRQGLEFELTKAVIREIEAKTPYKIISGEGHADTELTGTITIMNKNVILRTPLNEIRSGETVMAVAVQWKDLRTGEYLTRPSTAARGVAPDAPPGAGAAPTAARLVTSTADVAPELGESMATGPAETSIAWPYRSSP